MSPLSSYNLRTIVGRIMSRMQPPTGAPDTQIYEKIKNQISVTVSEIYKELSEGDHEKYIVPDASIAFTNNEFNLQSLTGYDRFKSLREITYGAVPTIDNERLNNAFQSSYYDSAILCALRGETLVLFTGVDLDITSRTYIGSYYRLPVPPPTDNDLLDIPDEYIESLIDRVALIMSGKPETKK